MYLPYVVFTIFYCLNIRILTIFILQGYIYYILLLKYKTTNYIYISRKPREAESLRGLQEVFHNLEVAIARGHGERRAALVLVRQGRAVG